MKVLKCKKKRLVQKSSLSLKVNCTRKHRESKMEQMLHRKQITHIVCSCSLQPGSGFLTSGEVLLMLRLYTVSLTSSVGEYRKEMKSTIGMIGKMLDWVLVSWQLVMEKIIWEPVIMEWYFWGCWRFAGLSSCPFVHPCISPIYFLASPLP